jgi:DNA (cytosine-5)-methyltransferase 1
MLNISDSPNDASACSLSQVLETGSIPAKYFLSSKACAGILRRAEKRGKTLPTALREALEAVADNADGPTILMGAEHSCPSPSEEETGGGIDVATTQNAKGHGRLDFESETFVTHSLRADGFDASEDGTGRGTPLVTTLAIRGRGDGRNVETRDDGLANAMLSPTGGKDGIGIWAVCYDPNQVTSVANRSNPTLCSPCHTLPGDPNAPLLCARQCPSVREEVTDALGAKDTGHGVQTAMMVRRLLPVECEALQGFPRGYTAVTYRGKDAADGNRYRAVGNSMAVPCIRWIGKRIKDAMEGKA